MSKYTDPSQRLRPETVVKQTGQSLQSWFQFLSQCENCQQQHHLLAQSLQTHTQLSQWWIHTIVTAYEYHKGWRTVNQQKGGYTFTLQKTLSESLETVYFLFTDIRALEYWLSPYIFIDCYVGQRFNFDDIAYISFLRVQAEKQIQLEVQTIPQQSVSKVSIDFTSLSEKKTRLKITHASLSSTEEVHICRQYWLSTLTTFRDYLKKRRKRKS